VLEARGEEIRRRRMFADEPPLWARRKQRLEGCRPREAGETMVASWSVGVLASMAGGRDGGGGRTAAGGASDSSSGARSESGWVIFERLVL
jgi:hypothetical protein